LRERPRAKRQPPTKLKKGPCAYGDPRIKISPPQEIPPTSFLGNPKRGPQAPKSWEKRVNLNAWLIPVPGLTFKVKAPKEKATKKEGLEPYLPGTLNGTKEI